jgi:hypothetical protein
MEELYYIIYITLQKPRENLYVHNTSHRPLITKQILKSPQPPVYAGSSLANFSTLKMEAICSSETSVYIISIRRHIPEDGILHNHSRENLKSYTDYESTA